MHTDEESSKEHARRSEKEAEVQRERDNVQDGSREGNFATDAPSRATGQAHQTPTQRQSPTGEGKTWRAYWDAQQQPWRTEPEIELARQEQLSRCLATTPDITRGIYPFKGMKLSRADVEWLLAAHENGRGPIARSDEQQNRQGLDLRGADLRYEDLHAFHWRVCAVASPAKSGMRPLKNNALPQQFCLREPI